MDDNDARALVEAALQHDDEAARELVRRLYPLVAKMVRPELRQADLSEEEQAVVENLAASSDELSPGRRFASRQLVEHLLDRLKPAERLVIDLLYLQGRSVEEIRKITGWSTSLIKVRAFRARQKMKSQLITITEKENS